MELHVIPIPLPAETNLILGQAHFIKTVEDLYEIIIGIIPQSRFGLAFCEASGPCLIRVAGNDSSLQDAAGAHAQAIAAGHSFIVLLQNAYPIQILNGIKQCPEVCRIYCATANPLQVIVAETEQGRGILGVIDGFSPRGVETDADKQSRYTFLRQIGYKL